MTKLNEGIAAILLPERMRRLPISPEGFPVPWFVAKIDNKYDFRAIGQDKLARAVKQRLCWLCGETLGRHLAFVIGPMCSVNKVSSEPPCHLECAEYAVKACPFLTQPRMRRNEKDLPEGEIAGVGIMRNPGVVAIWITRTFGVFRPDRCKAGVLFQLGPPEHVFYYREGRLAARAEVLESINSGMVFLRGEATREGAAAYQQLDCQYKEALRLLPAA